MDVFSIPFSAEQIRTSIMLESLPHFMEGAWNLCETTKLRWNWHLDAMCDRLEELRAGKIKSRRLAINIPPGLGKSTTVNVMWTTQQWAADPTLGLLTSAYSDVNTIRDNRKVRRIVSSDWFKRRFGLRLMREQRAKKRFDTTDRGWRIATSVDGQGLGDHPHIITLDDLVKAQDAIRKPQKLKAGTDYLRHTIETRVGLDPLIVLIGQRLSELDPFEVAMELGWDWLVLPMRYVRKPVSSLDKRPDPKDRRTEEGELLFPERWPEEKIRREEIALTPWGAEAQLQQYPVPPAGALIKRAELKFCTPQDVPKDVRRARGWDTAWTLNGGNWCVGTRLAIDSQGRIFVEHSVRAQLEPGDIDLLMKSIAESDGRKVLIGEGTGSGKPTIAAHGKMFLGYDYASTPEYVDKVSKAGPFQSQVRQGNVYVVKSDDWDWVTWINVVTTFPFGKIDDDVDSTVSALHRLTEAAMDKPVKPGGVMQTRIKKRAERAARRTRVP